MQTSIYIERGWCNVYLTDPEDSTHKGDAVGQNHQAASHAEAEEHRRSDAHSEAEEEEQRIILYYHC